ncbi:Dyp-type peroxidase [Spartinivicinus poritis]|uniref:Dyp-type peroxidase n=1 Tax=Spartinivicinus poritis TaxID=2994640 RepID=A0ABT5U6Y5_9GAMM|nr:Dyp-type peroxidase [Spartinivicinus sp. A2-2]MDE1462077.1 Dyp-type peroxidase [Spartinivicinus sp. A2-2]
MSVDLNQTNIDIDDPNFKQIFTHLQGNILKSHGRDHSRHLFIKFKDNTTTSRKWVREFADKITSTLEQESQSTDFKKNGNNHLFINLMLSRSGYQALAIDKSQWPTDKAFLAGMKDLNQQYDTTPRLDDKRQHHHPKANPLNDDLSDWEAPFKSTIDGLIILAYGRQPSVDFAIADAAAEQYLDKQVAQLTCELEAVAEVITVQQGHVMRNDKGQVIEHFGFVDGVSNPKFLFSDLQEDFKNGGFNHYDPSASLHTVMVKDPGGNASSYGSYVVYRKLQQNIKGFWDRLALLAGTINEVSGSSEPINAEYAGALCVGRFKDGTPISEQATNGWTNLFNNFNYDDDINGLRCPLHSHARKTNPRNDTLRQFNAPPTIERSRRIVRRGISYGSTDLLPAHEWTDAGLLFLSLQSNIEQQFIFMQNTWCNNNNFLKKDTGLDPLVGVPSPKTKPAAQTWPKQWGNNDLTGNPPITFEFSGFVKNRGGEYFFMPSINFLKQL